MIAIDTNILVRFLTRDDLEQFATASRLFKENRVYLSNTVLLETEWVLRYSYLFSAESINRAFTAVLGLNNVVVDDRATLKLALDWHLQGADFADTLHLVTSPAGSFHTFDKKLYKKLHKKTQVPGLGKVILH